MWVPAISDSAHRTLAIASDSARAQCAPILPILRVSEPAWVSAASMNEEVLRRQLGGQLARGALWSRPILDQLSCLRAKTSSHSGLVVGDSVASLNKDSVRLA